MVINGKNAHHKACRSGHCNTNVVIPVSNDGFAVALESGIHIWVVCQDF